jgi:hypothetical protein
LTEGRRWASFNAFRRFEAEVKFAFGAVAKW